MTEDTNRDPIAEALRLATALPGLLERGESDEHGPGKSDIRYAEALARTLIDHLLSMQRARPADREAVQDSRV